MKTSNSQSVPLKPGESVDVFMDGRLRLIQSSKGYRFSVDALLLSRFVTTRKGDWVVDLGAGCGIIGLMLLLARPPLDHVVCLEIQAVLADQALRNASLNGFREKMSVILGDIRHPPLAAAVADVVVCNPPYRSARSGRINPDPQRAIARHEILVSLQDILSAAVRLLKPRGRIAMVYPAARLADLAVKLRAFALEPKKLRMLHPGPEEDAKLVFVEAMRGARGGLKILPPLLDQGEFSISNAT
ncbi:MAG: methyltransferase [Desulfatiglandales bacterium]